VDKSHRNMGIGSKMIQFFIEICETSKLFTSTNNTNIAMRKLLEKMGFEKSGVVNNLDENDSEQIFFKLIRYSAL
jgi:ribosomal protein S18 acetylase RimI-like enzyme